MKVIFLDIDGVLNTKYSQSRIGSIIGVDNDKLKRLRKIVKETGAEIVLTSSWKLYKGEDIHLQYLKKKFNRHHLRWISATPSLSGGDRGEEIHHWLKHNDDINIESWIVLDDDVFVSYRRPDYDVMNRLIKTSYEDENGGLQDEHVEKAIELLGRKSNE